jgi:mRNA interferase YafQ
MYSLSFTNKFKKDFALCKSRNYKIPKIEKTFDYLRESGTVPTKYLPHILSGNYNDCWECHIEYDWLLIWKMYPDNEIHLIRTGTHSDLF